MPGVSPLDGTELVNLLADLTTGSNIHPGIHLIAVGARAIAEDAAAGKLDVPATQLLQAQLCGDADVDVVALIGALQAWLASPVTNAALHGLPEELQKTVQHQGELADYGLRDPDLREPGARVCAALDQAERGCTDVTDEKRKELKAKVKKANDQSINRPK
ncbi:hypothetical protein [Streptomyces longwoodensis]|uniref:hypothetical protein n=1 Tax=Streptomyces longwoodensis TaxID=68231 RepID=UPI002254CDCD|nr:hypothetical protein [Streptomyces longwoodensis]MCX5001013.1 hypothetical protein [Streptomyces longwoodensis]